MKTIEDNRFIDNVVETLRKAAIEIEELQVQAALGKAEAKDKYEEVKKKFNHVLNEAKIKIEAGREKTKDIHTKFDEFRVQLELGKTEGLDTFKEQKKTLLAKLHEIEVQIKTNKRLNDIYAFVLLEIEKFKIKLEVLEQKFERKKTNAKSSFEKGKNEFNVFIEKIKTKYRGKKEETKWEHFQDEISEAFTHFKKAFMQPS
ncbi:hypothetical protein [Seonamhaeicola aphaedonensis]|uniref:Uncharacterized protein n=1 Tax=Seonamhaeicola aphaedonensis TaxID=1461338 RepID=A0A3D9HLJ1_9FLAO|nr:hypothetical protein [Seonamhaeicola aphaedonensis]RED50360.1 hypothetical protein DFQ02_101389 [Seonamhaeicola aphaedonensis]